MSRNLVLTGASGLLGSHLVPLLRDYRVHAVGRTARRWEGDHVTGVAMDLSHPFDPTALPARTEAVVHLAQSPRFRDFPDGADDVFQVNTARLLDLLLHARRAGARMFVYASTGGVYAPADGPLREEDATAPAPGFYAATKLAGELLARSFAPFMSVLVLRYFFVYGAGQKRDMLIPRLVDRVRSGRPVAIQGEDGLRINPVHVADAAAATAAALALEGSHTINVAGPETLSLREICTTIGSAVGSEPVFERADGTARDLVADIGRMRERLTAPRVRLAEGIGDLL